MNAPETCRHHFFRTLSAVCISAAVLVILSPCTSTAAVTAKRQPLRLVTAPTAGTVPKRGIEFDTQLFDGGGVVIQATVGLNYLVDIGISYGGAGVIGSSPVIRQPHVGIQARVLIVEETLHSPAIAVGFDSQGDGPFIPERGLDRFRVKSRGAFLVMSRNYRMLGYLGYVGFHGGINASLEGGDGDRDPSFWAGLDKSLGPFLDLAAEYDFATNDDTVGELDTGDGYLNVALRWSIGNAFSLELDVKNILRSPVLDAGGTPRNDPEPSRELRFTYRYQL